MFLAFDRNEQPGSHAYYHDSYEMRCNFSFAISSVVIKLLGDIHRSVPDDSVRQSSVADSRASRTDQGRYLPRVPTFCACAVIKSFFLR